MNRLLLGVLLSILCMNVSAEANNRCSGNSLQGHYELSLGEGFGTNTLDLTATSEPKIYQVSLVSLWSCKKYDDGSCTHVGNASGTVRFIGCTGKITDDEAPDCKTLLRLMKKGTIAVEQNGLCLNGMNVSPVGTYDKR